jgi:hypothetical protein
MIHKAATPVELDSAVSVVHLEMKGLGAELKGGTFGQVKELGANSLPTVGGREEELVNPGVFAAVLQTKVEADGQLGDGCLLIARQIQNAIKGFCRSSSRFFRATNSSKGSDHGSSICMWRIKRSNESRSAGVTRCMETGMRGAPPSERKSG